MKATLLDDQGVELAEITSRLGPSSGQMPVDWASRPDALFQYYFDRGTRTVTAVIGVAMWSAVLHTRWQMGARFWFLRELLPVGAPAQATRPDRSTQPFAFGSRDRLRLTMVGAAADFAPAVALTLLPLRLPA